MRSLLTCHSPPLSVTFSIIVLVTKEDSPEFSTHLLVFMVHTLKSLLVFHNYMRLEVNCRAHFLLAGSLVGVVERDLFNETGLREGLWS